MRIFVDRTEAGQALAQRVVEKRYGDPVVLALPRGGLPVAAEVARALGAPLDVLLVRKIGLPSQPELAVGAVVDGETPEVVVNEELRFLVDRDRKAFDALIAEELREIERRKALYLKGKPSLSLTGKTAIVIDDGLATGATARAALKSLRKRGSAKVVLAVPVAPPDTLAAIRPDCDEVVCLWAPTEFYAVGQFYRDFPQLDDEDVKRYLDAFSTPAGKEPPPEKG